MSDNKSLEVVSRQNDLDKFNNALTRIVIEITQCNYLHFLPVSSI